MSNDRLVIQAASDGDKEAYFVEDQRESGPSKSIICRDTDDLVHWVTQWTQRHASLKVKELPDAAELTGGKL